MESLYAETTRDLDQMFEDLEQYESTPSVSRVEDSFTEEGNMLVQTQSYNAIVTPDSIQFKGIDTTMKTFLDLEEGEEQVFSYLKERYSSPSSTRSSR